MAFSLNRRVQSQSGYHNSRPEFPGGPLVRTSTNAHDLSRKFQECLYTSRDFHSAPSVKRRKPSTMEAANNSRHQQQQQQLMLSNVGSVMGRQELNFYNGLSTSGSLFAPMGGESNGCNFVNYIPEWTKVEDGGLNENFHDSPDFFMSRDEIERCSPSRKDGIDSLKETHLRYSYCAFLQNLGMRLELPQTTIGTAMVLCHRFFVRRSHACHDRFLIATASLFLAAKSEETPRPLNTVLKASCEICHKHDLTFFPYLLPLDWFEKYRERVIEAEQMILTTLDFELNVQHPYIPLTAALNKLGLSQSVLVNLAWNLVSEGGPHMNSVLTCMIYLAGRFEKPDWAVVFQIVATGFYFSVVLYICTYMTIHYRTVPLVTVTITQDAFAFGMIRLRSSLWLQFKPHHIAAGAAFLAAKFLNLDLSSHQSIWQEFQTTPSILQDVVEQLMELF